MPGKPHHSSLIPYEIEIVSLRHQRPPMPYSQIADLLQQKYNLAIQAPAIFKFIKVRARGRRVYSYGRNICSQKPAEITPIPKLKDPAPSDQTKPFFNYKPSDRYNLTRLSPEEAARRRKKLEEEGH